MDDLKLASQWLKERRDEDRGDGSRGDSGSVRERGRENGSGREDAGKVGKE